MDNTKEELYKACVKFIKTKEETILQTIRSNQQALNSETKSSAGDKHETGRAMLQLEMEKASQQLEVVHQMKKVLQRIEISKILDLVSLGSLVVTDTTNYFLSISAGEIKINSKAYYAISTNSPIGKLLIGKKAGDSFAFNATKIKIVKVY